MQTDCWSWSGERVVQEGPDWVVLDHCLYWYDSFQQVYFIINVDGKEVHKIENRNAKETFLNVKTFAGDNFYKAADASYKNLLWKNIANDFWSWNIFIYWNIE